MKLQRLIKLLYIITKKTHTESIHQMLGKQLQLKSKIDHKKVYQETTYLKFKLCTFHSVCKAMFPVKTKLLLLFAFL